MQVQQQNQNLEPYQYLQSEIDNINKREEEDKRRAQLREVILVDPFIDSKTGQLDETKFQNELERRVHSNVSVEEIAELYEDIAKVRNYNSENDISYTGKTASSNANLNSNSLWFLDVFDSLRQQRIKQSY